MSDTDKSVVVGTGTSGQQLKARWHKEGKGLSLKQYARKLVSEGDKLAQDWFNHKKGSLNLKKQ